MRKVNLIVSAAIAVLAIAIIVVCLGYPTAEAYGTGAPGPGLWPICIAVVLIAMSILLLVKTLTGKYEDSTVDLKTVNHIRVYVSMALLIIYMIILKPVGFILPSFVMMTAFIYWFSKEPDEAFVAKKAKSNFGQLLNLVFDNVDGLRQARPLWLCAVIALIATFSVYFIFKLGLNVPMNFGLYI
jgi:putative tricarboxylic transport membrane protein